MEEPAFEFLISVGNLLTLQASFRSLLVVLLCLFTTAIMLALVIQAIKTWKQ